MEGVTFKVSLRIIGDGLVPSEVTAMLGCAPTDSRRKGDAVETEHFIAKSPTGVWCLKAEGNETIDQAINALLDHVSDDVAVWAELARRYRAEFFIGVFSDTSQVGLRITAETLKRLSRFGLSVGLDIYCTADATA